MQGARFCFLFDGGRLCEFNLSVVSKKINQSVDASDQNHRTRFCERIVLYTVIPSHARRIQPNNIFGRHTKAAA
ncbi:MAG: hypothetical protein WCB36_02095, partial [Burkholderiales bacterium]